MATKKCLVAIGPLCQMVIEGDQNQFDHHQPRGDQNFDHPLYSQLIGDKN
jgi:hypothetical protein